MAVALVTLQLAPSYQSLTSVYFLCLSLIGSSQSKSILTSSVDVECRPYHKT